MWPVKSGLMVRFQEVLIRFHVIIVSFCSQSAIVGQATTIPVTQPHLSRHRLDLCVRSGPDLTPGTTARRLMIDMKSTVEKKNQNA